MELSDRFKALKEAWKCSQKEMAEKLGISTSTYQYYERGERDAPAKLLIKLTSIGVNPVWLMTGEGEMMEEQQAEVEYIDPALQIIHESEKETGITLNDRQREKVADILRQELKKKEKESKTNIIEMMKAFKE